MHLRRFSIMTTAILASLLLYLGSSVLLPVNVAAAHAYVIGSDPVDGSTINQVPHAVHIYFNAPISALSTVHIYSIQQGTLVDVTAASTTITSSARELVVPLQHPDTLPEGGYEVYWTALARDDGQTTFGSIGFNVGYSNTGLSGTPVLGPSTSNNIEEIQALDPNHFTNVLSVIWEWFALIALIFWVGTLLVEQCLLAYDERSTEILMQARKRSTSLQWFCLLTLFFGEVVALVLRFTALTGALHSNLPITNGTSTQPPLTILLAIVTQTHYGTFWLVRICLLLVAMGFLAWTTRPQKGAAEEAPVRTTTASLPTPPDTEDPSLLPEQSPSAPEKPSRGHRTTPAFTLSSQTIRLCWLTLAGLLLVFNVLAQSTTNVLQPHLSALLFEWLSLFAQSIWFGGFAYLAYVLLPLFNTKELDYRIEALVLFLRLLTPFLLAGIGIQLVSTLFLGDAAVGNSQQFFTDPYGRTLLVQIVLMLVMLALSVSVLFVVRPRLTRQVMLLPVVNAELPARRARQSNIDETRRGLRQMVSVIALSASAVLLCGSLLSFFSPPIVFPDVSYTNTASGSSAPNAVNVQSKQIGDLTVTLLLQPGKVEATNTVVLTLLDKQGKLVTDAQVQLTTAMETMNMGSDHVSINSGNSVYTASFGSTTAFDMAGVWDLTVQILRPGQPALQGIFHITLS